MREPTNANQRSISCLEGYHAPEPRISSAILYWVPTFSSRGDTVRFILWNEKARGFNTHEFEREAKPTVMAVSSWWVKTYGGNVPVTWSCLKHVNRVVSNKRANTCRVTTFQHAATYYYLNPPIPETSYILIM